VPTLTQQTNGVGSTQQTNGAGSTQQTNATKSPDGDEREQKLDLEMQHLEDSENHNVTSVVLGTTLLWFGWFGFNGGSAQGANLRAVSAVLATHVAACAGGSVGLLLEWLLVLPTQLLLKDTRKTTQSVLGFCDGAIAGLVAITPAAGYVRIQKHRWSYSGYLLTNF
jgi:Amt family ammonium transporter